MKRLIYLTVIITHLAVMCNLVSADMLTFDDITTESSAFIPDGYGGFDWDNFLVVDGSINPNTSYDWGRVSDDYTATNGATNPAGVTLSSGTFDFNGIYFTENGASSVQVIGYLDTDVVYDTTVILPDVREPTWFQFDYTGVDELRFITNYSWVVMDNFTFNETVVPLPAAFLLGILGMGVAGIKLRKFA